MNLLQTLLTPQTILIIGIIILAYYLENKHYKKTTYYQITHQPLLAARLNKGLIGEFLTYKYLRKYEAEGAKFLFNIYVPKADGGTSEIDVMMIHKKGVFVFESKNYSGWIFGNETQRMWTQTLRTKNGRSQKNAFYNPIMQNRSHISHMTEYLGKAIPAISIIVFSERCTLKNVKVKSEDIHVIKRNQIAKTVNVICNSIQDDVLSESEILDIYNRLYPFTQVDATVKEKHISDIKNKKNSKADRYVEQEILPIPEEEVLEEENQIPEEQQEEPVKSNETQMEMVEPSTEADVKECPRCGGNLILRTATKGTNKGQQFYGCSNFPKCRYIER